MAVWISRGIVVAAALFLVYGASGGPGWTPASDHAVLAIQLQQLAAAPLYGLVASVAACLPAGEVGFRLAVANGLLGALAVAGVLRAARALLPKDPHAGIAGAVVLVVAPPFRDAAGIAGPAMLAAAGAAWTVAFALEHARAPSPRGAVAVIAGIGVTAGGAPWLGLGLGALAGAHVWRAGGEDSRRALSPRDRRRCALGAVAVLRGGAPSARCLPPASTPRAARGDRPRRGGGRCRRGPARRRVRCGDRPAPRGVARRGDRRRRGPRQPVPAGPGRAFLALVAVGGS
ncbi:MAG: hypothetical protein KIT31_26195 [Deltaproteobacteria bacterium]|nr:hypothetical protein [Deltaproteobacteria bacterium]